MGFDFSRGSESIPFPLFLAREPARSSLYRIPGQRVPKFLVTQSRSGAALSVFVLSSHPAWMPVGGSEWRPQLGLAEGK